MRALPEEFDEGELIRALAAGWNLQVEALEYVPEGGGSYHWRVVDAAGTSHFVTVDDLDHKSWLGDCRESVFAGLRRAFDTAGALRFEAGLDFVVAPQPTVDADTVARLGSRYAVALFPFLEGEASRFGRHRDPEERAELVRLLVELHQASPVVAAGAARHRLELAGRRHLDTALDEVDTTWQAGPFSEPARTLLAAHAASVIGLLETFDHLATQVATHDHTSVITHGEPHSGNLMRVAGTALLVDWDTVALAPPERDLWMVVDTAEELALYADATRRDVDPAALTLYRLRWSLDDIAIFVELLRSPHAATNDTEHAMLSLTRALHDADRSWWPPR